MSLLADGELTADEIRLMRPHLKSCLACRSRWPRAGDPGQLRGLVEALVGMTQDRAAALGERVHAATELAAGFAPSTAGTKGPPRATNRPRRAQGSGSRTIGFLG